MTNRRPGAGPNRRPGAGRGPILAALFLALALLVGQQAAALHDLAHATERITQKDSAPAHHSCAQCFLGAQLAGALAAFVPSLPEVVFDPIPAPVPEIHGAPGATRFAFLSRAPPALL